MSYKERTVGGGPARQLGEDWTKLLSGFINTGSFGGGTASQQFGAADPGGSAQNVFSLLNSIISNPQADRSVQDLIARDTERGRNQLQESFGGGTGLGSPAAFAQALFESEQVPRTTLALDQMARDRLASILPIFGMAGNTASLGIPQAQTTLEPPKWLQAINLGLDVANTAANFIPGGGGGATSRTAGSKPQTYDTVSKDLAMVRRPVGSEYITSPSTSNYAQQLYS